MTKYFIATIVAGFFLNFAESMFKERYHEQSIIVGAIGFSLMMVSLALLIATNFK